MISTDFIPALVAVGVVLLVVKVINCYYTVPFDKEQFSSINGLRGYLAFFCIFTSF